ncbi:MAG: tannase/feruloyl esterase family alpha/beta hydrolase, partial [Actinomycetes bacterium]
FILLADRLPLVHQAVLDACDASDGVADGVLDDPRRCDFDPATLVCDGGDAAATCLSTEEADVVRKLHDGAVTEDGRARLEPEIAHEWGSELEWSLFVPATADGHSQSENFALSYLRYLAWPEAQDPGFELSDLQFTRAGFWDTVQSSSYMSALDPDLDDFRRDGGKLLLWHGWNDQHISPQSTLAYWDAVNDTLGERRVDAFARLFMLPGVAHCGGGDGPSSTDVLTPVMAWVESGAAPAQLDAASYGDDGTTVRTRPVFPYPQVARYDGTGSTDDAANFVAVTPRREPGPGYRWLGQRLYSSGYQTWARADGDTLSLWPHRTWLTAKDA